MYQNMMLSGKHEDDYMVSLASSFQKWVYIWSLHMAYDYFFVLQLLTQ